MELVKIEKMGAGLIAIERERKREERESVLHHHAALPPSINKS